MIIHRNWGELRRKHKTIGGEARFVHREGWFLLGFIPLYVRDLS